MIRRLRGLLWLVALAVAVALVWSRLRIVFFVRLGWLQLVALVLVLAVIVYVVLDYTLDRLLR